MNNFLTCIYTDLYSATDTFLSAVLCMADVVEEPMAAEEPTCEPEQVEAVAAATAAAGEKAVMQSTMDDAHAIATLTARHVKDVATAGAAALADTIVVKTSRKDAPASSEARLAAAVKGSEVGSVIGDFTGRFIEAFIPFIAKRAGAHQCDNCGKENLYNYYKCASGADVDLCFKCHASMVKDKSSVRADLTTRSYILHDNTMFTLKYVIFTRGDCALWATVNILCVCVHRAVRHYSPFLVHPSHYINCFIIPICLFILSTADVLLVP